jgi:4'-phosphopantetheinyl transferase
MIFCCYTEINNQWSEQELADQLSKLPKSLRIAAQRKRRWQDKQLSIAGKLLLLKVLEEFDLSLPLDRLHYNDHKRPYFDAGIDFNISHSGNIVICCGTDRGMTGIDIEQINKISLDDYPDYFTPNEWQYINNHPDRLEGFYNFWTRKEAVLKAIGTGFHTPLSSVDVSEDQVIYDGIAYYIRQVDVRKGYKCHIAFTEEQDNINVIPVEL